MKPRALFTAIAVRPPHELLGGSLSLLCCWGVATLLGAAGTLACAMPSAPAGIVESGAPSFVVLGPEAIGLSSVPTDLHVPP